MLACTVIVKYTYTAMKYMHMYIESTIGYEVHVYVH